MTARETYVYRPRHPQADEFGFVAKHVAGPKHESRDPGFHVMGDIEPYRSVASDVASGKRPVIGGRRQHREFLKRNGFIDVGNEYVAPRREELSSSDRIADIRRAIGE